jgi:hypothetical protein
LSSKHTARPINTILGDYGTQEGSTVATSFGGLIFGNDSGDILGGGKDNDSIFAGQGNDLVYRYCTQFFRRN